MRNERIDASAASLQYWFFPLDTAYFGFLVVDVGLDEFLQQALYSLFPELVGWNGLAATLCLGKLSHA